LVFPAENIKITVFWDGTPAKLRGITFQDRNINIHLRENLRLRVRYDVDLLYFIGSLQTKYKFVGMRLNIINMYFKNMNKDLIIRAENLDANTTKDSMRL
jgi:hypothetical protein